MRRRLLLGVIAGVVLSFAGSTAQAHADIALGVSDRCPVFWKGHEARPIAVTAVGLLPGQAVTVALTVRDRQVGEIPLAQADATGTLLGRLTGWDPRLADGPGPSVPALLTMRDRFTGQTLETIALRLGTVGIRVDTAERRSGRARTWEVSGLSRYGGTRTYFAHYFKRGKWVGLQKLGLGRGPCGYLRTRKPLLPSFAHSGTYRVRVQSSRRYRRDLPYLGGTVRHRQRQR